MRFRTADLRTHGWERGGTLQIPDWCGCSTEYVPIPTGDGWWSLVPIWDPAQTPNPLRRWEPAVRTGRVTRDASHALILGDQADGLGGELSAPVWK
jgi:hypothetical protein